MLTCFKNGYIVVVPIYLHFKNPVKSPVNTISSAFRYFLGIKHIKLISEFERKKFVKVSLFNAYKLQKKVYQTLTLITPNLKFFVPLHL